MRSPRPHEMPANPDNMHATPQDLAPERVAELLAAGEVDLVDVREAYERAAGYIEGSRHVALGELSEAALDRTRPVVFVCRVGGRSAFATQALRRAGYDAYNLDGGIVEWVRCGLPLAPDGGYVADH